MNRARRGTNLFRLAGFQVSMDLSWLVIAFLVTWTLAAGVFPGKYPTLAPGMYWLMGIACSVGLLISIVLHEFSHSLVARKHGMPIGGITLFVFGGMAHMESEPPGPKEEALMALAGPASSIVIGGALYGVHALLQGAIPIPAAGVLQYLALINLVLAGFNLLPAFPLDGGRVLRAGLWARTKSIKKGHQDRLELRKGTQLDTHRAGNARPSRGESDNRYLVGFHRAFHRRSGKAVLQAADTEAGAPGGTGEKVHGG